MFISPSPAPTRPASVEQLKRRYYLGMLAAGMVALTIFLVVPGLDSLRNMHMPMLAAFLAVMAVAGIVLRRFPHTLHAIERTLALALAIGVLIPPLQAWLTGAPPADRINVVTAFDMWSALVYVFAYLVFGSRTGLRLACGFLAAGTIVVTATAAGAEGVMPVAAQYLAASALYIAALHLFALVLERTVAAKAQAEIAAQYAYKDPLTGLGNRLLLQERLEQALQRRQRHGTPFALCMLDLDDFKAINDHFGHQGGDDLLTALAKRLANAVRGTDTVVRLGGDEFAVIATDVADDAATETFARRILSVFDVPFTIAEHGVSVSGSVGISQSPGDADDAQDLLIHADAAMYQAKRRGKSQFALYRGPAGDDAAEHVDLSHALAVALDRGELDIHYQPLYDLRGDRMVGVEALLRWHHPELGNIPPAHFIPIAEKTGLIHDLGTWVLATACKEAAHWQRPDRAPLRLAVNVSAVQFAGRDFPAIVRRELNASGLSPKLLELEITERVVTHDRVVEALEELRSIGVRVALDDFGTGYSSLGQLQDLPIDGFKIDRAFVNAVQSPRDATKTALVLLQTMVSLADGLGLSVVAEGVETAGQMEVLRATGCTVAQGFLLARPMPASRITALLNEPAPT